MKDQKKYYSLYLDLRKKILSGEFASGEKLPSKRVMADIRGISLVTVEHAYTMLEEEGYIFSRERSGYFVSRIDGFLQTHEKTPYTPLKRIKEEYSEPKEDFEYSLWFKTIRKVISERDAELFVKAPSKGCVVLRNALVEYLYRYRGMTVDPNRIVIGSGAEQLYEIAVKLLGRDKVYGIEDPSYSQIRAVYLGAGAKICPLSFGNDGIESHALEENKFDVLHVTPFHSYPSGITTSIAKRYEYLHWAHQNKSYVIEDDFDSEFFMPGHPIEPLYSLDRSDSVIYINTFSKSLSHSMRMGYMILPESLLDEYEKTLGSFSCSVPVLDQYVLAEFIRSGSFERHLNRMRRKMKEKDANKKQKR
ncbi:MAG: PLP-dependent aminotransferase family protein [Clostridia bacterium]|nr:PLP-dependent aminotransferase family protein [Clostridia bacterium]